MPAFRAAGRAVTTIEGLAPGRRAASRAAGVPRCAGVPVRLLHGRHDHDRGRARRGAARQPAARPQGQPVPLHRLPRHRRRAPRHRPRRGRRRRPGLRRQPAEPVRACASSPARRATRWTSPIEGLLHLKVLRSPHAHARILAIDRDKALAVPGVVAVFTWEDVPRRLYSTATHEDHLVDPDDTYMLDNVVRFVGQRVAAVVAETEAAAEALPAARRRLRGPARGLRSGAAMAPGAPLLHDKGGSRHAATSSADIHGEIGSVADGLRGGRRRAREDLFDPARPARASRDARLHRLADDDGRLHVRTSSQAPFITQQKLCHLFGLPARDVHVFTERVGGGFGGKQEMLAEDLCVLATLKTGRPVKWEFTREEQFIGATTRHQMTTRVKLGAKRDGTLTAIEIHVVSNTGAYGSHAGETLAAALGSPLTAYRCPNKKADGYAVYTNMVPAGGFRGYGARRPPSPSNAPWTSWRACSASIRSRCAARTWSARRLDRVGLEGALRRRASAATVSTNASILSSGRWPAAAALPKPARRRMGRRHRHRAGDAGMRPADRASLRRADAAAAGRHLSPRRRHHRDGQRHDHLAPADRGRRPRHARRPASTSSMPIPICAPYDTGTFASTGTVVAGQAVALTAAALRDNILDFAAATPAWTARTAGSTTTRVICGERADRARRSARGRHRGRPSLRGQAQGLSVAAHRRLQRAGHPARRASHHRRDPHPAQRARRRHRPADQPDAMPRPDRRRHRAWASAGR